MSGIRALNSTGNDPYNIRNIATESDSIGKTTPVRPDLDANIQNQNGVGAAGGVSENPAASSAEESKQRVEREKKGLQECATERIAEEQLKAQMKQTQLTNDLDAVTNPEVSGKEETRGKEYYALNWKEENSQPIPFHRANGDLQRWDVHDKMWE